MKFDWFFETIEQIFKIAENFYLAKKLNKNKVHKINSTQTVWQSKIQIKFLYVIVSFLIIAILLKKKKKAY